MDRANGLPLLLPNICHDLRGRDLRGRVVASAPSSATGRCPADA